MLHAALIAIALHAPQQVEVQPLVANVRRVASAMEFLGAPLSPEVIKNIEAATKTGDEGKVQQAMDQHVLLSVHINAELRVKVSSGVAPGTAQQGGFTPFLVKVRNEGTTTRALDIVSPQAGLSYSDESEFILKREARTELAS